MRPTVCVVLCVDADPDRPEYGGARYDCPDKLTWSWLSELASKIDRLRKNVWQTSGVRLLLTWFLRSDSQIRAIYGDAGWALKEFELVWKGISEAGDELGWHPHYWRWSESSKCWYNEIIDTDYMLESYDVGFTAFKDTMGFQPAACRTGINFHNNHTMMKLDDLGVKVDLSAHSGLTYYYSRPKVGGNVREGFDWGRAPLDPYHPSGEDYQSRSTSDRPLKILEVPMTVWCKTPSSFAFWKGLIPFRVGGKLRFVRPIMRGWFVANVWGDPYRFELGVEEVFKRAKAKGIAHYGSSLHPDDLTDLNYRRFAQNLDYLIRTAEAKNIELSFNTASQAYARFR